MRSRRRGLGSPSRATLAARAAGARAARKQLLAQSGDARRDNLAASAAAFAVASGVCEDLFADELDRVTVSLRLAQLAQDAAQRWQAADTRLRPLRAGDDLGDAQTAVAGHDLHDAAAQLRWLARRRPLLERFGLTFRPAPAGALHLAPCDPAAPDPEGDRVA